jgi:hypothetical protein
MKSTFLRLLGAAISGAAAAPAPRRKLLRVVDMTTILFLPLPFQNPRPAQIVFPFQVLENDGWKLITRRGVTR